ncbi:cytochrome P450 [Castellaniella sp. S9]|uniref:cytochrome P450 n=1 Tax=Castellaniella sp. S9 TaxID=2993652 RepID=UPI0022B32AA7|nr:cytochrome P450 [Castellaniella sp. S9]
MTAATAIAIDSQLDKEIREGFSQWIGEAPVYWHSDRNAWVVTGYEEGFRILKEAETFWRDIPEREGATEFWGRHLLNLSGRDHRRLHAMHMRLTGEDFAELIRPMAFELARGLAAQLVAKGSAELAVEYADTVPMYIGSKFLGIDTSDENFMRNLNQQMQIRAKWKEELHAREGIPLSSKIAQDGQKALEAITQLILPTIRDRRDNPRDDLISRFWAEGPTVFPDWGERDVMTLCWSSLDNETKPLLRGLLYIIARDQDLQARLRANPQEVQNYVEEGLRYLTPFRTIRRTVLKDVDLNGTQMKAGDGIYVITPLTNRSEEKWECPYSFNPEREQTTHFALGFGAGYCVGRYVGRVEAAETIKALLAETQSFELDPKGREPKWAGEMYHSIAPLDTLLR